MSAATPAVTVGPPATVTIAVALIYVGGVISAGIGVLVLLSRYDVGESDVLLVSLIGAGIILFGLLMLAVGGGVARGSRSSRLIVTVYLAVQLTLQTVSIATSDDWDWFGIAHITVDLLILAALWLPPGAAYFRRAPESEDAAPAAA